MSHSPEEQRVTPPDVPARAERARRMTALLAQFDFSPFMLAARVSSLQRLIGFGGVAYGVLEGLCMAWILALLAIQRERERRHGTVRYRSQATASRWCRFGLTAWAMLSPWLLRDVFGVHVTGNSEMVLELGGAAMVVLLLPPVVALFLGWWWQRGWPRLVALAAGSAALLSLADWMPVLEKRPDVLAVAPAVALAAWELIDHFELRRLLRQTDREIAGVSVGGEGGCA